jgi:hypothetical protein
MQPKMLYSVYKTGARSANVAGRTDKDRRMKIRVTNPKPVLEFESNWYTYLKVSGHRVLELANECGTCVFMYSRLRGVEPPIAPQHLAGLLEDGLQDLSHEIIDTVSLLIPSGEYLVGLLNMSPRLVKPAQSNYMKSIWAK